MFFSWKFPSEILLLNRIIPISLTQSLQKLSYLISQFPQERAQQPSSLSYAVNVLLMDSKELSFFKSFHLSRSAFLSLFISSQEPFSGSSEIHLIKFPFSRITVQKLPFLFFLRNCYPNFLISSEIVLLFRNSLICLQFSSQNLSAVLSSPEIPPPALF